MSVSSEPVDSIDAAAYATDSILFCIVAFSGKLLLWLA